MWLLYTLFLLVGGALADHHHAWETGQEYRFHMQSRTLTALENLHEQFSGILMKGVFTVQVNSSDTLHATISKSQYASVHQVLPGGWDSKIPKENLEFRELPLSTKPFEIKMKQGIIRDLLIQSDVPAWEVNVLKSIVSQLQIDTQGENTIRSDGTLKPNDEQPFATFKTMEDSVGGECEVLYDITPLSEDVRFKKPELVPLPHLRGNGYHFDITKTKNYTRCKQRMAYNFGMNGKSNWKPGSSDEFLSRLSTSRVVISGDLKRFTIQSSVMTNKIIAGSTIQDSYAGVVYSKMNLTLNRISKISNAMLLPDDLMSTGNLVYMYNSPFSDREQRNPRSPSVNHSSESRSNSSSEESHSDDDGNSSSNNSSSSNSSSSSASSSEERDYFQPKSELDEPPNNPLLPYFVGYKGRSIQRFEKNYATEAVNLIGQITTEIEHFSTVNSQRSSVETLEKFTILIRLIRTMNSKQIAEVESKLPTWDNPIKRSASDEEKKCFERAMWNVYRDAIAEAGTGPALIIVKDWIKNRKVEGMQASRIVSIVSKSARTPTAEYIKTFFEMITDPDALTHHLLNTTGPAAFADMVRKAKIGRSYYPVYSFGRMISKQDNSMIETYIPYMGDQLRKAIRDADSPRIQTYIVALGNFGYPKILSIFEPYLEGTLPITKFQRTLMIMSLSRLVETAPRITRNILYKIYLNTTEADEVRCAAVYVIMKTDVNLKILQRMARFTNQDESKQVNSAVKSSIELLANSKQKELQVIAHKARKAKKLLNPQRYGEEYSKSVFKETIVPSINLAYRTATRTIGSDDSKVPKIFDFIIGASYGGFNIPSAKMRYAMSSIKPLQSMWEAKTADVKEDLTVEKIVRALNIQCDDPEQFEGNYYVSNAYGMLLYPFDKRTVERLQEMLQTYAVVTPEPNVLLSGSVNYIVNYDAILGFPTESGLPFINTFRAPKMARISGEASYHMKFSDSLSMKGRVAGHTMQNEKIQSRVGFVTPFEHKHYIAGIDINAQFFVPIDLEAEWNPGKKTFDMRYRADEDRHDMLFNFSIIPYTARHDILDLKPVLLDRETRIVHTKEPQVINIGVEPPAGVGKLTAKSDNFDGEGWRNPGYSPYNEIFATVCTTGSQYKKIDLAMPPTEGDISVSYNIVEIDGNGAEHQQSSTMTVPPIDDKSPNSEARQKQFLEEISKDINSATVYAFDVNISNSQVTHVVTLAIANSNVDEKSRMLFYWNLQGMGVPNYHGVAFEFCLAGQLQSSPDILLDFEKAIERLPKQEFNVDLRMMNCTEGEKMFVYGNLTRSNDFKRIIMDSEVVRKCQQEMREGNKGLRACQQANAHAAWKNHVKVSMGFESMYIMMLTNYMVHFASQRLASERDVKVEVIPRETNKHTIDLEVKLFPEFENTDISFYTPSGDIKFTLPNLFKNKSPEEGDEDDNLLKEEDEVSCTLDKTQAVTFDDKVYPLKLGKCWHIMMITYSQRDPDNFDRFLTIPEEFRVAVKVREMDDGNKEIQMIFGEKTINLQKSGEHLEATVNGEKVEYSQYASYREKENDEIVFEFFELPDESIRVVSDKYNVKAVYDGERIRLEASDKYRNSIRGLCGTYDTRSDNDFITPKNCILEKPEEFAATYALTQDDCQGPALENNWKAKQSNCTNRWYRCQSDVIMDSEADESLKN